MTPSFEHRGPVKISTAWRLAPGAGIEDANYKGGFTSMAHTVLAMTQQRNTPVEAGSGEAERTDVLGPAIPVDDLLYYRLKVWLVVEFGDYPEEIDHHLDLLDRRGALYAAATLENTRWERLDLYFGVVRHVVTTQCTGGPPPTDIEGWLAAGRPDSDHVLDVAWDQLNERRYGGRALPITSRSADTLAADPDRAASVLKMDQLMADPRYTGILAGYADVSKFIEDVKFEFPPLTPPPTA
ncbi:MAG TPA: hypothetical protein DEQ43_24240 [Nocardioides bacterium]|nr:hypothetical protein [Nocardioides sp.]